MKYTMCKRICVFVIIIIHILQITYAEDNNDNSSVEEISEKFKNKTKRGVFYVGKGLPSSYSSIYGYNTPLISTPLVRPFTPAHLPYVIRPGGASITSYNINYLRHPYIDTKAFLNLHPFPSLFNPIIPSSQISPLNPIIPANHIIPTNPIIPSASIFPTAPIVPTAPVFPTAPIVPAAPVIPAVPSIPTSHVSFPTLPAVNPLPPNTFFVPQRPVIPLPGSSQKPGIVPSASGQFPSIIPIGIPGPTVPTTSTAPATPTVTPTIPNFPPHYPHGQQPWRPVSNTPTISTPSVSNGIHRPSITLLPPYEGSHHHHHHKANIEDFQSPNREYLVPLQQLQQQRQQQLANAVAAYHNQRLLDDQQSEIANQVENVDQNGNYYGVSSYDVPLHGNKGYSYN